MENTKRQALDLDKCGIYQPALGPRGSYSLLPLYVNENYWYSSTKSIIVSHNYD